MPEMSARIAPEPISSGFRAAPDYRSRATVADSQLPDAGLRKAEEQEAHRPPVAPQLPPIPAPPPPPGAAFAAALISGQLPPRPTSEREILLRLGSAQLPAQGSLPLTDRRV